MSNYKTYNLLESDTFLNLSQTPSNLRNSLTKEDHIVVIDEIQKLPELLDEIHLLIEEKKINFLLTGSSARKLRKGGVNLLGGRARKRFIHPFIYAELKEHFNLKQALKFGLIPSIYFSDDPYDDLSSYVGEYLQQEIIAESLIKKIPSFSRFLEIAALSSGKILNYSNVASDSQVPVSTVQDYFQILRDTLIGFDLPIWKKTIKRKPINTSKFYFFDIGVVNYITKRKINNEKSPEYGDAFEHYFCHELKTYTDYLNLKDSLYYWRSSSGHEVDFILADKTAIEVKSKMNISNRDLKGLKALMEENKLENYILVYKGNITLKKDNIEILPWEVFLNRLWQNDFI